MEIIKINACSAKNIRIRMKSRTVSKQRFCTNKIYPETKQKIILNQMKHEGVFRQIQNEKNLRHTQNMKKSLFLTKNQEKRYLALLTSQKGRKLSIKQIPSQINIKSDLKRKLINQDSNQQPEQIYGQETQRTSKKISIDQILRLKNSQKINQNQNYKNFPLNIQPNFNNGFNFQDFNVNRQFSITVIPSIIKKSVEVQTYAVNVQDKYFHQYIKFRTMKGKIFSQIQEKQAKMKSLIKETINFDKNHQKLIKSIDAGPQNEREKRVFCLAQDLSNERRTIRQSFQKLKKHQTNFQQIIEKSIIPIKKRKYSLTQSILHLSQSLIFFCNANNDFSSSKQVRILERIKQHTKNLTKIDDIETSMITKIFSSYHIQNSSLIQKFKKFESLLQENRILLCNFIQQIQKIPVMMISLFGLCENTQNVEEWDEKTFLQTRYEEYLSANCQKCYYMDKKINLIQFHNTRIKPILKSLLWLVKNRDTQKCCLTMI